MKDSEIAGTGDNLLSKKFPLFSFADSDGRGLEEKSKDFQPFDQIFAGDSRCCHIVLESNSRKKLKTDLRLVRLRDSVPIGMK